MMNISAGSGENVSLEVLKPFFFTATPGGIENTSSCLAAMQPSYGIE